MNPFEPTEILESTIEVEPRAWDSGLGALLYVAALILLACAPAIVIYVWKAAL